MEPWAGKSTDAWIGWTIESLARKSVIFTIGWTIEPWAGKIVCVWVCVCARV